MRENGSMTYEVLHGFVAGLVDIFHVLQDVMRKRVDDSYSDVVVV